MSLTFLREQTGPRHAQLEEELDLFRKVRTREEYGEHLRKFHAWLAPFETALLKNLHSKKFYQSRRKIPALERDLVRLALAPPPSLPQAFSCSTLGQALGALYVIEGSSLGAQVISRHYAGTLGLTPATGLEFFTGYGAETGARWREFLSHLEENFRREPALQREVTDTACAAFESIGHALSSRSGATEEARA